jgi:hypothetical protein
MVLLQWSRHSFVLVASIFAVGGFLIGSSSSQEERRGADGEVGRYQLVRGPQGGGPPYIFDTKTARYWTLDGEEWKNHLGPLAGRLKPLTGNSDAPAQPN